MRHKYKCRKCGYKFYLKKDNLYTVKERLSVTEALTKSPSILEAFDCPICGCQNIVGIREERMKVDSENASEED